MSTSHELARKMLEGPEVIIFVMDTDYGFGIIDTLIPAYIKLDAARKTVTEWSFKPADGFESALEIDASLFGDEPMGLNKRVYTELHAGNGPTLSRLTPGERAGWKSLINGDKAMQLVRKTEAEASASSYDRALESVGAELKYSGIGAAGPGQYIVVDVLTESRRLCNVDVINAILHVSVAGGQRTTPIEQFYKDSQRWFLLPKLSPEDLTLIRSMPVLCEV